MKTPLEYFLHWVSVQPDAPFLRQPYGDTWTVLTYAEAAEEAGMIAAALHECRLQKGDHIAIYSKNCMHWVLADLAIMMGGFVSVPLYPSLPSDQVKDVLRRGDLKAIFAGKTDRWTENALGDDVKIIRFPHYEGNAIIQEGVAWGDLLSKAPVPMNPIMPQLDDLWTILFTSGTTGDPKGVMHTYRSPAEIFELEERHTTLGMKHLNGYRFFSFLPLNHVGERIGVEMNCLLNGGSISFAESIDTFHRNLVSVQPTFFFAVPRIWMKFRSGVYEKAGQKTIDTLMSLPLIGPLVRRSIRKALGLGQAGITLTGAAITPDEVKQWYRKLGIELREVYGMTEACGPVTLTPYGDQSHNDVGKALPGTEVRVDESSGEIIYRSPHLMTGYYKDAAVTEEVLRDGWIYSGDRGRMDDYGKVYVLGRIRDVFKTAKGVFVAPDPIEEQVLKSALVSQVCVAGLGLPQPIALINLHTEPHDRVSVQLELQKHLTEVNRSLSNHEKLAALVICSEAWNEHNRMLTPTLKIRRSVIDARYGMHYQRWHDQEQTVIWENGNQT